MRKASVFPEPVFAAPSTSLPAISGGIPRCCISVNCVNFMSSIACMVLLDRPRSENCLGSGPVLGRDKLGADSMVSCVPGFSPFINGFSTPFASCSRSSSWSSSCLSSVRTGSIVVILTLSSSSTAPWSSPCFFTESGSWSTYFFFFRFLSISAFASGFTSEVVAPPLRSKLPMGALCGDPAVLGSPTAWPCFRFRFLLFNSVLSMVFELPPA